MTAARNKQGRFALGAGVVGILLLAVFFSGHDNPGRLADAMPPINRSAQKQGFVVVWTHSQPDLLIVNLAPHGYGRIDVSDNATWYYLAFCHARYAAGYSVVSSLDCAVELGLLGTPVKRRSLGNLLFD